MKKLDKQMLRSRRDFLRKTVKRAMLPVLAVYTLSNAKADPLFGESRQGEVL